MDELNHDFQALALEGRAMGEVSEHILLHFFLYFLPGKPKQCPVFSWILPWPRPVCLFRDGTIEGALAPFSEMENSVYYNGICPGTTCFAPPQPTSMPS